MELVTQYQLQSMVATECHLTHVVYKFIRFAYILSFKWFNYDFIHILHINIPEKMVCINSKNSM